MEALSEEHSNNMMRLHEELEALCERVKPTSDEQERREQAVGRLRRAVRELWPAAVVEVFGSLATGLYVKGLSDIDVMIVNAWGWGSPQERLATLARHLMESALCYGRPDIKGKARVPIVRFREGQSRVEFDVSLQGSEQWRLQAEKAEWMKSMASDIPALRPLYMVLKLFMQQRQLNQVYEKGGLNSYTLFVMLAAYLQMQARENSRRSSRTSLSDSFNNLRLNARPQSNALLDSINNFGFLLLGFFHFYGSRLKTWEYGISSRNGGGCFRKVERPGFYRPARPYLLAVEDPLLPRNDLGEVAFGFPTVRTAFQEAYRLLTSSTPPGSATHLLTRIIDFDAI